MLAAKTKKKSRSRKKREASDQPSVTPTKDTTETPDTAKLSTIVKVEDGEQQQLVIKASKDQNEETRGNKTPDVKE